MIHMRGCKRIGALHVGEEQHFSDYLSVNELRFWRF